MSGLLTAINHEYSCDLISKKLFAVGCNRKESGMDLTNSKEAFIGTDVSCAKRKRIPIVFAVKEKNRLVLTGFGIVEKLKDFCTVIEVYLQAIIREILPNVFHKTKRGVSEEKLNAIAQFTGWPTTEEANEINYIAAGSLHDRVDAYSAAWVASLSDDERGVFGDISNNDAIHIPAKHLTQNQPAISRFLMR